MLKLNNPSDNCSDCNDTKFNSTNSSCEPTPQAEDKPIYWEDVLNKPTCFPSCVDNIGEMKMIPFATIPSYPNETWVTCNGAAYSRSIYSILFSRLGVVWGNGDGINTFNIPDMRSRVPMAFGQGTGLTNRTIGSYLGAESDTQSHNHTDTVSTALGEYIPEGTVVVSPHSDNLETNVSVNAHNLDLSHVVNNGDILGAIPDHSGYTTGETSLTIDGNSSTIESNLIDPTINNTCTLVATGENPVSVVDCNSISLVPFTAEINSNDVASSLSIVDHDHTIPDMNHDITGLSTNVTVENHIATLNHVVINGPLNGSIDNHTSSFEGTPTDLEHAHTVTINNTNIITPTIPPVAVIQWIIRIA